MQTYIALLRGINVGGSNHIKMDKLKESLISLGLLSVSTYIQSGNILFQFIQIQKNDLLYLITEKIKDDFGITVPVHVLTAAELNKIISANPFTALNDIAVDKLHVTFLSQTPGKEHLSAIHPMKDGGDEAAAIGNVIYLHCPNGYGRTKFSNTYFDKKLKVNATTRNWKTIKVLQDLAKAKVNDYLGANKT